MSGTQNKQATWRGNKSQDNKETESKDVGDQLDVEDGGW